LFCRLLCSEIVEQFESDTRFKAVTSESLRRGLLERFMAERDRRIRESRRMIRLEQMDNLKRLLEDDKQVTVNTLWKDFKDNMRNEPLFLALERLDRLQVFEDHIRELEQKIEDKYENDRDDLRRNSRKAREAFRVR